MTVGQKISLQAVCFGFFIFMCNVNNSDVSQLQSHYVSTFAVEEHIMLAKLSLFYVDRSLSCVTSHCVKTVSSCDHMYMCGHQDFALMLETGDNC